MKRTITTLLFDAKASAGFLARFRKGDDGGMIIFSLFMLVLILWFGGTAVDLMRYETVRAKMQGTLDRATLAAADLDQVQSPPDVVRDYFTKAGMIDFLVGEPYFREGLNYRVVRANAQADMPMMFSELAAVLMRPFNPDYVAQYASLTVSGTSTAEERVSDVEVSLVLDVSTSMNKNSRMTNLRPAAREFVSTVLANNTNAPQGLITISMVPYSATVNPGPAIIPDLNINRTQDYSTCPLFPSLASFSTTTLDLTQTYDQVGHFDYETYQQGNGPIDNPWCFTGSDNAIIPHTSNIGILHTAINELDAYGNTAIDMGMKWAVGLLDPSTQSIITRLAGAEGSNVPAAAAGRPYPIGTPDVLKVIVLMTDGENTYQFDLKEPYKSGLSFLWFDLPSNVDETELDDVPYWELSLQVEGTETPDVFTDDKFYWDGDYPSYKWYPNGFSSATEYRNARAAMANTVRAAGASVEYSGRVLNASWQDIFNVYPVRRVNNDLLYYPYRDGAIPFNDSRAGYPDYRDSDYAINDRLVTGSTANTRLSNLCQVARNAGIIIYTVAFEAPANGQTALRGCASSASHYFNVAGTDISEAFSAIASDIRALKLTQ